MNISLSEKNAVICGSTQGIGLAVAEELALLGANCTLIARNDEALKSAIHQLDTSLRQKHTYFVADFFNTDEVKKAINAITTANSDSSALTIGPALGPPVLLIKI